MGKQVQDRRVYPVPESFFREKLRAIESAGLNLALKSENETPNGVWFRIHHGVTWSSWGEKITVTLTRVENGTDVQIISQCGMPTQVIDWGKNSSNIRVIFNYLEKGMPQNTSGQYQPSYAPQPSYEAQPSYAPQQPYAAQPPAGQAQPGGGFCGNCGSPTEAGTKFCTKCGFRLV